MLLLLVFVGCKKIIVFDIDSKVPTLVVNAFISNDSLFNFTLSTSQSVISSAIRNKVSNATIEVFDKDSNLVTTIIEQGIGIYQSSFARAKPNTLYRYKINALGKVYAINEATPDSIQIEIKDTSRGVFKGRNKVFITKLKLTDRSILGNYFSLKIKKTFLNKVTNTTQEEWCDLETLDFILTEDPKSKFSKKNLLFTDRYFNNQSTWLNIGCVGLFDNPNQTAQRLDIYASTISSSAFQFLTSLNENLFFQNDPFSQSPQLFGNLPNAHGAIYSQTMQKLAVNFL